MATAKSSTKAGKSKTAPKKPAAKVSAKPAPKKAAKAPAKPVGKTAAKSTAKPAVKSSAKSSTQLSTNPSTKSTAKSNARPATKVAPKAATKAPAKAVKTVAKPAPKTAPKPAAKPVVNQTSATKTTPANTVKSVSSKSVSHPPAKESSPVKSPAVATPAPSKSTYKPSTTIPAVGIVSEAQLLKMSDKDYMNEAQMAFFLYRLKQMEIELRQNADETTEHLRETAVVPDPADRATIEEEHALELRTRDRERKLLKKVRQSIVSIEAGDYGYCEETGEPIGIPRLLARPTATLSLEAQQRRELKQKMYGD